jgi:uncharacterized protein (DUF169 family)
MNELGALEEKLNYYLRLTTFPVAVKMIPEGTDLTPDQQNKRPSGLKLATCQGIGMARRNGQSFTLTGEDLSCAPGLIVLGFSKAIDFYQQGGICEGMYTVSKEAGARTEAAVPKFSFLKYKAIILAPLSRAKFEPEVVVIYGNSAQVMRLIQAALYKKGGTLISTASGRLDCGDSIVQPMTSGQCHYVIPCTGDRSFGLAADYEVIFTAPFNLMPEVIEGLEGTHKGGVRYPIFFPPFEAKFPPKYQKLMEMF